MSKKMQIKIRRFRKKDINSIRNIAHHAFDTATDKYWSVIGALRAPRVLVAEKFGKIVGVIEFEAYRLTGSVEGHIWYIFVHPRCQRMGIGSKLLARAENIMMKEGAQRFWAITGEDNTATRKFFEKNGYREVSVEGMKKLLGGRNTKKFLRRMVYWEGDVIYMKKAKKRET